jgi:hypothetical protein
MAPQYNIYLKFDESSLSTLHENRTVKYVFDESDSDDKLFLDYDYFDTNSIDRYIRLLPIM